MTPNVHKDDVIGIVGVGYVGLPLAMCFAERYMVIGYDISQEKIGALNEGRSYIDDVPDELLNKYLNKSFFATTDKDDLKQCNYIMIAVPTPIDKNRKPDLGPVIGSTRTVSSILQKGQTVILESTTYPGTVEEVMAPILEEGGMRAGKDFFLAYSPERIDPGNKKNTIYNTPKIVGGCDEDTTQRVYEIYQSVISAPIKKVSNIKTAEATKIFENVFRAVNIALVNELSIIFDNMGINTWEVIDAASTKPMGFMAHYPGVGVGGHCIPVDPYYLSYKAKKIGHRTRFIELAGEINHYMPIHIAYLTLDTMTRSGIRPEDSKITVLGVAYKPNTNDTRDSPSIDLIEQLKEEAFEVRYYDPFVPLLRLEDGDMHGCRTLEEALDSDCVVLAVPHDMFSNATFEQKIQQSSVKVVIDCKNILNGDLMDGKIYKSIGNGRRI
ncbi:MAG TPA: nucleotide sugar dehydrogenase [Candidatus Methanofastidiosa archaeon]|nr:nucleotide sugar dehydrogenase [Candidatus Methanofastidiosa archaeon]